MEFTIVCDRGTLDYSSDKPGLSLHGSDGRMVEVELPEKDGFVGELQSFVDSCQEGIPPADCLPEESAESVAMALAMGRSRAGGGARVALFLMGAKLALVLPVSPLGREQQGPSRRRGRRGPGSPRGRSRPAAKSACLCCGRHPPVSASDLIRARTAFQARSAIGPNSARSSQPLRRPRVRGEASHGCGREPSR